MLTRMNAITPMQAAIFVKLANKEPISPKSMMQLDKLFG
jgi:hypothetical protein